MLYCQVDQHCKLRYLHYYLHQYQYFLSRQSDEKFTVLISYIMIVESLVFSIYSSITANTQFLGDVSENWPTYFAMYLSILIPTIMSTTLALTYNVRSGRKQSNKELSK